MDANSWLLIVITVASLVIVADCNRDEIPISVSRRFSGDIITSNDLVSMTCNVGNNLTFLVDDGQCVDNQELIRGIIKYCGFYT